MQEMEKEDGGGGDGGVKENEEEEGYIYRWPVEVGESDVERERGPGR